MLATIFAFINAAIIQGIPLLFGATGEIITEKSGNLNLGIPGIMYMGGISGIIGGYLYEHSTDNPAVWLCILIPLLSSLIGSMLMALIYSFLTITLRVNQNVTGLALTTFGIGVAPRTPKTVSICTPTGPRASLSTSTATAIRTR